MPKGSIFPTLFDRDPPPEIEEDDGEGIMAFFGARIIVKEEIEEVAEVLMTPEDIARYYELCPIDDDPAIHK